MTSPNTRTQKRKTLQHIRMQIRLFEPVLNIRATFAPSPIQCDDIIPHRLRFLVYQVCGWMDRLILT